MAERAVMYAVATVIMCGWALPLFAWWAVILWRWAMKGTVRDGE